MIAHIARTMSDTDNDNPPVLAVEAPTGKGRGRDVCTARLERTLGGGTGDLFSGDPLTFDAPPTGAAAAALSAMYQVLLGVGWDGCLDTWDRGAAIEPAVWSQITNDRHDCSGSLCPHQKGWPYLRARGELRGVDVRVTNHAMLLSDLELGGGVALPDPADSMPAHRRGARLRETRVQSLRGKGVA